MKTYNVSYPEMIVHREGCADIQKVANRQADTTVVSMAASLNDFLDAQLAGDLSDMGYTRDSFDCKPCTH